MQQEFYFLHMAAQSWRHNQLQQIFPHALQLGLDDIKNYNSHPRFSCTPQHSNTNIHQDHNAGEFTAHT